MYIWWLVCQKQVSGAGTSNYIPKIPWNLITCPCPCYLLLAHKSSYTQSVNTYICLLLLISMLWHRQAIFESKGGKFEPKVSDTNSQADWMPNHKPTELSRIKLKKFELDSPSLWSASIQPTQPHCQLAFAYTCLLLLISMFWHRQAIFESKGDNLSSSAECRIRTQGLRHQFASRLNPPCSARFSCFLHSKMLYMCMQMFWQIWKKGYFVSFGKYGKDSW